MILLINMLIITCNGSKIHIFYKKQIHKDKEIFF